MDNQTIQALKDASNKNMANVSKHDTPNQAILTSARVISLAIYSVTETLHEILNEFKAINSSIISTNSQLQDIRDAIKFPNDI